MLIESSLLAASGVLAVPALVCCAQVLLALRPGRPSKLDEAPRPRIGILMPAHNEAQVIVDSLRSIIPQLRRGDRLMVIADNCTDSTAGIAAGLGVEVVIRYDAVNRGKGYALDFGLRRMADDPPEVLIIMDADCQAEAGCIDRLARLAMQTARPVQALYLMHAPAQSGTASCLAEFAWVVKNQVRPLGAARLGLPCQLTGTGMAFPWQLTRQMQLANANIVEDMQLGIDLAVAGHPPVFCPEARVSSVFPLETAAAATQRTRWEHGHLGLIRSGLPRLLAAAVARHDGLLLGLALDLAVPPLALLALFSGALAMGGLAAWLAGATSHWSALTLLPLALLLLAVTLAWAGWGRHLLSWQAALAIPRYAVTKIPLYLQFVRQRQTQWIKTRRD
ncbi:MAG: glycosyltransferase family 2 protein [Bacteroidota bacterium]